MLPPTQQSRQEPLQQVVVVHPVGQRICEENELFPRVRKFRDLPFALCFLACVGVLCYLASTADLGRIGVHGDLPAEYKFVPGVWAVGLCSGTLVGILFALMLRAAPLCMVWTCLLATPAVLVLSGVYVFSKSGKPLGADPDYVPLAAALLLCAAIQLCFVACYKKYVPMTAEVLRVVAHVLLHHLAMLIIGVFAAALHLAWLGCVVLAMISILNTHQQDQGAISLVFFFITTWGLVVFRNVAYLSYCSVFGQWYFGQRVSTFGSFGFAVTKGFGPVCFGSLIIAIIRTLRYIARSGKDSRNGVVKIVGCIIDCLLACIEDMVEWFSSFAYVQVALRGCGFCDAARATMHLCTSANVDKICASVLTGSVTFMGCLISGCVATFAAGAYAATLNVRLPSDSDVTADELLFWWAAGVGSLAFGFFSAGNVMKIVEAGVNTILVCWAERPGTLETSHPEIHTTFMGTSRRNLATAPGIQPALH